MLKTKRSGVMFYGFDGAELVHQEGKRIYVKVGDKWDGDCGELEYVAIGDLLADDIDNVKQLKSRNFTEWYSIIHYGAPAAESGYEMCSHRTRACTRLCLNTAGNGRYASVQIYRIAKTRLLKLRPDLFWPLWRKQLSAKKRKSVRLGRPLAARPNGTTDHWDDSLEATVRDNPDVQWYDYSAVPSRVEVADRLDNYHVTLSRKGTRRNLEWLRGHYGKRNVAVVVTAKVKAELMAMGAIEGIKIVDFDAHDVRLPELDGVGVIGILTPKGRARGKRSEFVVETVAQLRAEIVG